MAVLIRANLTVKEVVVLRMILLQGAKDIAYKYVDTIKSLPQAWGPILDFRWRFFAVHVFVSDTKKNLSMKF